MKIAIISSRHYSDFVGGIETFNKKLVEIFSKNFDNAIIDHYPSLYTKKSINNKCIFKSLGAKYSRFNVLNLIKQFFKWSFFSRRHINKILLKYDLIIISGGFHHSNKLLSSKRTIFIPHMPKEQKLQIQKTKIFRFFAPFFIAEPITLSQNVMISKSEKNKYYEILNKYQNKNIFYWLPFFKTNLNHISKKSSFFGTYGRLDSEDKNFYLLNELLDRNDVKVWGSNPEKYIDNKVIEKFYISMFKNTVDELDKIHKELLGFLLFSNLSLEMFPMVIGESIIRGTPIIYIKDESDLSKFLNDNLSRCTISCKNLTDVKKAMNKLQKMDSIKYLLWANKIRKIGLDFFSEEKFTKDFLHFINSILNNK